MKKSLIGKMIKRLNLKSLKNTATKTIALALVLGSVATTSTGCIFNFNDKKKDNTITPGDLVTDVAGTEDTNYEGPVMGDADIEEKPLNSNIPSLDTDNKEPDLGSVDEKEDTDVSVKDEVDLQPEDTEDEKDLSTNIDTTKASKIIRELKSSIDSELKTYFKDTKTTADAKFSVEDIIYVEANSKGLEIGFTTDAGNDGGYCVINVGNVNDAEKVKSYIGGFTSKAYLATMDVNALQDLISICAEAVEDNGISKNIDTYYLIPITTNVSDLGELVVAYYKSFNPNSENCKKVADGFEYSANVLIQDVDGMTTQRVTSVSSARLGRNQYFKAINDSIKGLSTEEEVGFGL